MWHDQHIVLLLLSEKLVQTLAGPALAFLCRQNRLGSSTGPEKTTRRRWGTSLSAIGRGLMFFWGLCWLAVHGEEFLCSCYESKASSYLTTGFPFLPALQKKPQSANKHQILKSSTLFQMQEWSYWRQRIVMENGILMTVPPPFSSTQPSQELLPHWQSTWRTHLLFLAITVAFFIVEGRYQHNHCVSGLFFFSLFCFFGLKPDAEGTILFLREFLLRRMLWKGT